MAAAAEAGLCQFFFIYLFFFSFFFSFLSLFSFSFYFPFLGNCVSGCVWLQKGLLLLLLSFSLSSSLLPLFQGNFSLGFPCRGNTNYFQNYSSSSSFLESRCKSWWRLSFVMESWICCQEMCCLLEDCFARQNLHENWDFPSNFRIPTQFRVKNGLG